MNQVKSANPALIGIDARASYLPTHSRPDDNHFTFAYTVTISNAGDVAVQLLSRHWQITDADGKVQEVRGEGVIGEQPVIRPGRFYRYTSGAVLATPVGFMQGEYTMILYDDDSLHDPSQQIAFEVPIPAFTLHTPTSLN